MGSNSSSTGSSIEGSEGQVEGSGGTPTRDYLRSLLRNIRLLEGHLNMSDLHSSDLESPSSDGDIPIDSNLLPVFQTIFRSGQIRFSTSSDDDSDLSDIDGNPHNHNHNLHLRSCSSLRRKAAKEGSQTKVYEPDVSEITKNDINYQLKPSQYQSNLEGKIPSLIRSRELGQFSAFNGFDKSRRYEISRNFLPNTVRKIANYGHKAFCGTYSQNGDIFLSASQDRIIRIYDTTRGCFNKLKKINARDVGWSILDTAFSPDGNFVVYSSWSECVHICNIFGDRDRHDSLCLNPDIRRFCIFSLAFSADGNEILGGANDGGLYVYDRYANQRVLKISAHDEDVNTVSFADNSSHILFSAADDGLCKVWDRRTLRESDPVPVGILAGHIDGIAYIDSKRDGRYLITNSKDQSIKLWDMRVFASQEGIENSRQKVRNQNWDYRWQCVPKKCKYPLPVCMGCKPVEGDVSVMTYRGHSVLNTLIRCHFSPSHTTGQRLIYTGCASGQVVIYDVLTGQIEKILRGHSSCVRDVSWHPYNLELVSTSWDNTVGLWTYEGQHALEEDEANISSIQVHSGEGDGVPNARRSSRVSPRIATCPMRVTNARYC